MKKQKQLRTSSANVLTTAGGRLRENLKPDIVDVSITKRGLGTRFPVL